MYAKLEEEHGLARHAMTIYERATKAVLPEEQFEVSFSPTKNQRVQTALVVVLFTIRHYATHIIPLLNFVTKVILGRIVSGLRFTTRKDWQKNLMPPSEPIRLKSKTVNDLHARVFPRLGLLCVVIGSF